MKHGGRTMNIKQILKDHKLWLEGAGGTRADLQGANLRKADLQGANLQGANLREADLRKADLQGANLLEARLCKANLQEANLREAYLQGARLCKANLQEANLREANLQEACLCRANLADIKGKNILTFSAGKDFAWTADQHIKIGCIYNTVSWWLENYKAVGKENGYTEEQIRLYGKFIASTCERRNWRKLICLI